MFDVRHTMTTITMFVVKHSMIAIAMFVVRHSMIAITILTLLYNGCVKYAKSVHPCLSVQMAQHSFEMEFVDKLYEKCLECQKYLIPKEVYYKTIEDLKTVTKSPTRSHITSTTSSRSMKFLHVVPWRSSSRRESHQKTVQSTMSQLKTPMT